MNDKFPGGLADKKLISDFDQEQLKKGIKIEMEHTDNLDIALEIATDHLTEHPDYYSKLEKMESGLENNLDMPIRQNHDYGGDFTNKIRSRLEKRNDRMNLLRKIGQPIDPEDEDEDDENPDPWAGFTNVDELPEYDDETEETKELPADHIINAPNDQFEVGDQVKLLNGRYAGMLGYVSSVVEPDQYIVTIIIFGRPFPLEGILSSKDLERHDGHPLAGQLDASRMSTKEEAEDSEKKKEALIPIPPAIRAALENPDSTSPLMPVRDGTYEPKLYGFPKYEYNLYHAENDEVVRSFENSYTVINYLSRYYDKLIPVIRDAAILIVLDRSPGSLLSKAMYPRMEKDYPEYIDIAVEKTIINHSINSVDEPEKVYDNSKKVFLRQFKDFSIQQFVHLMINSHSRGEASFGFLIDRLLNGQEPELKEILREKIKLGKLNSTFLMRTYLYSIFPEESFEVLANDLNITNNPSSVLQISEFLPEFKKLLGPSIRNKKLPKLLENPVKFQKIFTPEERQKVYSYLKSADPATVFHAVAHPRQRSDNNVESEQWNESYKNILEEVPIEIWDSLALNLIESKVNYFFFIKAPENINFSEGIVQKGYQKFINNIQSMSDAKRVLRTEYFDNLIGIYGIPNDNLEEIMKVVDEESVLPGGNLSKIIGEAIKVNFDSIDSLDYFEKDLYSFDLDSEVNINKAIEDIGERDLLRAVEDWRVNNKRLRSLKKIIALVNKNEIPLTNNSFKILSNYTNNHGDRSLTHSFINSFPLGRVVNLEEETINQFNNLLLARDPEKLFKTNGFERTRFHLGAKRTLEEMLDDFGVKTEELNPDQLEAFRSIIDKENSDIEQQREDGKIPLIMKYPELLEPALHGIPVNNSNLESVIRYVEMIHPKFENVPHQIIETIYNNLLDPQDSKDGRLLLLNLHSDPDTEYLEKLINADPERYVSSIKAAARVSPGAFLNSEFGKNREIYEDDIIKAIDLLKKHDIVNVYHYDKNDLINAVGEPFYNFILNGNNDDLLRRFVDKVVEFDAIEQLIHRNENFSKAIKRLNLKVFPIKALRKIKDIQEAKEVYSNTRNALGIVDIPDEIKVSESFYQREQRPNELEPYTRYTISNNNIDPTDPLYDIGKQLIHAGDGVEHTNVGASGFTNSWALTSFIEIDPDTQSESSQDSILIEQYQSDYPPVLHAIFTGDNCTNPECELDHEQGKASRIRLIKKYGDREAISAYLKESRVSKKTKEKIPEEILNMSVDKLEVSVRAERGLRAEGIETIGQLLEYSKSELLRLKSFGRKSVNEIIEELEDRNLSLSTVLRPKVGDLIQVVNDDSGYYSHEGNISNIEEKDDDIILTIDFGRIMGSVAIPLSHVVKIQSDNFGYLYGETIGTRYDESKGTERDLPIELAPVLKDARTHFEYISKVYPYLAIINTIKVAQSKKMKNIFISKDAPTLANIKNEEKAKKLYTDIPSILGTEVFDQNHGLEYYMIPATDHSIKVMRAMAEEATGQDGNYNFSLSPAQNKELKIKRDNETRKKKQEWTPSAENKDKLLEIENKIREMLPEADIPNFYTPQQALRFLGQEVKGRLVNKKRYNKDFGMISRELGMLARASRRKRRFIKLASLARIIKIGEINEN